MSGKQFDRLDITDCDRLTRDYVCAQCWGSLIYEVVRGKTPKRYKVYCQNCGEDRGFVTRSYAERRKAESNAEKAEAERNLGAALGIEKQPFDLGKSIDMLWPD